MRAMLISLAALAVTALLVEVARRIAPAIGLTDSPSNRKTHRGHVPLVGGIAIFTGTLAVLAFGEPFVEHWPFFVAAGLIVAVGVWDDAVGASPLARLAFQAVAVLMLAILGSALVTDLGNALPVAGALGLGWMAIPFTVLAGLGVINAYNMCDGVDGLCGTLTLVALVGLGIAAGLAGREAELVLAAALGGAVVGFLLFNLRLPMRNQAAVFLGDAGSYLLGLSVFYLAVRLCQGPDRAIAPVTALWFCMVPLLDTAGMILRRLRRGKSPFSADREHIHHVFLLANFSVTTTWAGLTLVATAGMAVGLFATVAGAPESLLLAGFLVVGVLYYGMMIRVWTALRFLSRSINRRKMALADRRVGAERRVAQEHYYVNGDPVERRSGNERRRGYGDRRDAGMTLSASAAAGAGEDKILPQSDQAA